jgi:hypothetical protein
MKSTTSESVTCRLYKKLKSKQWNSSDYATEGQYSLKGPLKVLSRVHSWRQNAKITSDPATNEACYVNLQEIACVMIRFARSAKALPRAAFR